MAASASLSAASSSIRPSLLTIPGEIRNYIYALVLFDDLPPIDLPRLVRLVTVVLLPKNEDPWF
jgi:hypothetical protein